MNNDVDNDGRSTDAPRGRGRPDGTLQRAASRLAGVDRPARTAGVLRSSQRKLHAPILALDRGLRESSNLYLRRHRAPMATLNE